MASLPFSSLRARLVVLVLLAVLPALVVAVYAGFEERRVAREQVRENTMFLTRLAAGDHERLVALTRQLLSSLSHLPEVAQATPACRPLLDRLVHQHPIYAEIALFSADGLPVCGSVAPLQTIDRRLQSFLLRALQTADFAVGDVETGGIPPRPTLTFGYPLKGDGGAVRGVLFAALDLDWLQKFAEEASLPKGGDLLLLDGKGVVLARHPLPERSIGRPSTAPVVQTVLARRDEGVAEVAGLDGVSRLYAFAPLPTHGEGSPLFVALGVPPELAYAPANRRLVRYVGALGIVALLSVFTAWMAGDVFIVRRVKALLAATSGLAAGNLGVRTGLAKEPGALGQLAREFDEMAETLQRRQEEMEKTYSDLHQSEALKTATVQGALDGVITVDSAGRILEFNPAAERTFGCAREQALGQTIDSLIVPKLPRGGDRPGEALFGQDALAERQRVERTARRADGTEFPIELSVSPIEGVDGGPLFTAFVRDITERKQAEEALRKAHDELQKRVEARTTELKDANERLVDWVEELQQRAQDMRLLSELGDHLQACHTVDEAYAVVAQYGRNLFPDQAGGLCMMNENQNLVECVARWGDPPPVEEVFTPEDCWALRRGRPHVVDGSGSHLVCRHVGDPPPAAYVCVPLMAQGAALGVLHLVESSGQRHGSGELAPHHVLAHRQLAFTVADQVALSVSNLRLQEKLRDQAIRDPLTGLFNRRYMQESLDRELRRAQRRENPLGVIMMDIDHFKRFNDTFGHAAGDALLKAIGQLLMEHTRGEDIACRYGGEEFTLILLDASAEDTEQRASLLREQASRLRVEHGRQPLGPVTISLGVAVFPDHGDTAEVLLKAADQALYRAKAGGRDRVVVAPPPGSAVGSSA